MTAQTAKQILALYRPGTADAQEPEMMQALSAVRLDPELQAWFDEHCRVQTALRDKFREIPVPVSLKGDILAHPTKLPGISWWRDPDWLPLAACIVLFIGLCISLRSVWETKHIPDHFADFQSRMVRSAVREYHMDIATNDLTQVRQLLSAHGAPADFALPKSLAKLSLTGGGVLHWRNHPVAMMCFDRGDKQMLFLFVMNRSAVKDPPGTTPALDQVSTLAALGWSEADKTYVLAGPQEADFYKKYF